jgi:hypothetical protein
MRCALLEKSSIPFAWESSYFQQLFQSRPPQQQLLLLRQLYVPQASRLDCFQAFALLFEQKISLYTCSFSV